MPFSVATASADCTADCTAAQIPFALACMSMEAPADPPVCPAGCQDEIDKVYSACGGCDLTGEDGTVSNFDDTNAETKTMLEAIGCAGAAQVAPLFAAVAAVATHFLN